MKKAREKKCAVNVGRWMSYATAGAAMAMAANDAEAGFTYLYSGPLSTQVKAGSGSSGPPPFPASVPFYTLISNGHPHLHGNIIGYLTNNNLANHHKAKADFELFMSGEVGAGFMAGLSYASKLASGLKIAAQHFLPGTYIRLWMASSSKGGNWKWGGPAGTTGFLAFEFPLGATEEYGWAKVENFTGSPKNGLEMLGYAYSSDPNFKTGQIGPSPEPASLALLALGAVGLVAMRIGRKRNAAA